MKTVSYRSVCWVLILLSSLGGNAQNALYNPNQLFTPEELRSDFNYLRSKLEKKHPNLFLYTSADAMKLFLDSIENCLVQPATEREFYHLLSLLNGKIKDGHTMILPSEKATQYYNTLEAFFPFFLRIDSTQAYIRMNCSSDPSIPVSAAINRINDVPIETVLSELIKRQVRDGENTTYPSWILTQYFKEYYSFSYGHPASYELVYKTPDGKEIHTTVKALKKDSIAIYKKERYPAAVPESESGKGITIRIDSSLSTAILTIKSFDNSLLRNKYQQSFKSSLNDAFHTITEKKVEHLILDLRDNQGGDFEPGRQLLSFLIQSPLVYLESSPQQRNLYPAKEGFKGKLYVLINGGSFSNSGIVSSYLAIQKRAIFFGEETAGNRTILSGDPVDVYLPNTHLYCQVSTTSYVITHTERDPHGVFPQYKITPSLSSLKDGKDEILEAALRFIKTPH